MNWSELYWQRITPLHLLLWPISLLFTFFQSVRHSLYRRKLLTTISLPVPVIVIDSITTTSPAKIPLIIEIVRVLRASGLQPAIIGHGYADNYHPPVHVTSTSSLQLVGKKSLLLAYHLRETCPVWIGRDRIEVAKALLATHQECNVLICNDGMQNLRLQRDFEAIIVDASVINTSNGLILPAGPLRDSFTRLKYSDAIVLAGHQRQIADIGEETRSFYLTPFQEHFFNLSQPELTAHATELASKHIHAVVCDPNIQNFLDNLNFLRLTVSPHLFSESHHFTDKDIQFHQAEIILVPEEDAVKFLHLHDERIWVLQQDYRVDIGLREIILTKLREKFMDPKLLDILVCPLCKSPLVYKKAEKELICKADRLAYPIRDGIPVMLEEEARKLPAEEEIK
jgi:tetraacyldisaccharide 4'-kinase